MNAQVIALVNQKGGVGKSTSCVNLGVGLAQAGKKVLLVDCDPQSSLSISLGHPQPDNLPITLSDMMGKVLNDQPIIPGEGILHHPEGVDLMPSNIQLSGMEVSLVNAMSRETVLRQYLDTVRKQYTHAAMYLLTASEDLCRRTETCFCKHGIEFGCADLRGIPPHDFTLFSAARDIYTDSSGTMVSDLANAEVVDTLAFSLIVNALLVARYGCPVLKITDREGKA